jgi:hypothetical protein
VAEFDCGFEGLSGFRALSKAMGYVVRPARRLGSQLRFSSQSASCATSGIIGDFRGAGAANGAPGSDLVQVLLASVRGFATGGRSRLALRHEIFWSCDERLESSKGVHFGARNGSPSLLGCGVDSSASVPRSFASNSHATSSLFPTGNLCQLHPSSSIFSSVSLFEDNCSELPIQLTSTTIQQIFRKL